MSTPIIMTVTGELAGDQLGPTLAHEHLYCDISNYSGRADNRVMDVVLMADELAEFRQAGGRSIIENAGRNRTRRGQASRYQRSIRSAGYQWDGVLR